jgi:drug/metabolite transporter (DMT)-like permease
LKPIYRNTTFLAILACFLWSTAFVGVKTGLQYTSPFQFAGLRFIIAGLLILPFTGIKLKVYFESLRKNIRIILIISFLQTVFQYSMFYLGMSLVPSALAAIIIGSGPLFIAMMAHLFMPDDKMSIQKLLIFLLGVSGIVVVTLARHDFIEGSDVRGLGILFLLFTIIASGFANIAVSRDKGKTPPLVLSSASMVIGGLALYLFSIPVEGFTMAVKPIEYYIALSWLSFLSAAAVSIWFILLGRPGVKVSDLNFWKFLIPVVGAVLSWIIIPEEKPVFSAFIGMGIVALSLVMLNFNKRNGLRKKKEAFLPNN